MILTAYCPQTREMNYIFFLISKILVRPRPRSSSLLRKSTLRSPRSSLMSLMSTLWSPSLHYGHWGLPILIRINPVTLIHTPHCPLTRKIKIFFKILRIFIWYEPALLLSHPRPRTSLTQKSTFKHVVSYKCCMKPSRSKLWPSANLS